MTVDAPQSRALVLQSCRPGPCPDWLQRCLESVRAWCRQSGTVYRFVDDALFADIPANILDRIGNQTVIASDLGRLRHLQRGLAEGFERVIWLDADVLIFHPTALTWPDADMAVGRQIWVQADAAGRLRCWKQVHNAALMFRGPGRHSTLDFYADTAQRLLAANRGAMPAQFIGPKLLTALHNVVQFPVIETVGMLSPAVVLDLLSGSRSALDLFLARSPARLVAANLCQSSIRDGALSHGQMDALVEHLCRHALA